MLLYISSDIESPLIVKSAIITIKLQNPSHIEKEAKLIFRIEPYEDSFNLLPKSLQSIEPISLRIIPNRKALNVNILHKEPAFLGKFYAVAISLRPIEGYEVTNVLLTLEDLEDTAPRTLRRKHSYVPYDSDAPTDPAWKFLLFADTQNGVERLLENSYAVQEVKAEGESVGLCLKFRAEGVKHYEVKVNSVSRKVLPDKSLGPEFSLENSYGIEINVLCPFVIEYDWFNPSTSVDSFASKGILDLKARSAVSVRISTKSYEKFLIHDVQVLIKDQSAIQMLENSKESNAWPVPMTAGEVFIKTVSLLPLSTFFNIELGVIQILWSRAENMREEKNVCVIPMEEVTCREPSLNVIVDAPAKGAIMQEFSIQIKIVNPTPVIVEAQMNLKCEDNFLIQGEMLTNTILLPSKEDCFNYTLFPTKCGRLKLPYPLLYVMASGKVSDIVVNRKCEKYIQIFP
eukprot:TRINITY_DN12780_c0_g1_i1.p1 TRINITY_DN12780_c0_g1~~TRINITY_DN12780_c0_g1_i1.p1  ORF type:complete len:458 (-),score=97.78 TRINITY_DN12780_c0_g1_i1:109-1482(-)